MSTLPTPNAAAAFHNGGRGYFNAWFFDAFDDYFNYAARAQKEQAFAGLSQGTIVELGAGTGADFDYVAAGSRLIAVEPNLAMHDRLRRNAASRRIDLTLLPASAEDIPLPNESVDVGCRKPSPGPGHGSSRAATRIAIPPASWRGPGSSIFTCSTDAFAARSSTR